MKPTPWGASIWALVIVVCYFPLIVSGHPVYHAKAGSSIRIQCPCRTDIGSFSKSDEKGAIWSNGIVAKDKRQRYSFENNSIAIENLSPSDQGSYVWVCDEEYVETRIHLHVIVSSEWIAINCMGILGASLAGTMILLFTIVCVFLVRKNIPKKVIEKFRSIVFHETKQAIYTVGKSNQLKPLPINQDVTLVVDSNLTENIDDSKLFRVA
jgi:hypothetical protein